MSIFGQYFVVGLLREAGWPQKQGIFRKNVVDTVVLDGAVDQMVDWAAGIGAGHPKLALQMIAEMFRERDWSGDNAPSIKQFIEGIRSENDAWNGISTMPPKEVVSPTRFTQLGRTIDAQKLTDPQMRTALEHFCLQGLLWGLANPDSFIAWYASYVGDRAEKRALETKAGLEINDPSEISEFFNDCEVLLRKYEEDIQPLPPIPARLAKDAQALDREI